MDRYYFGIHDGQRLTRDYVGSDCDGQDAIRNEAMYVLPAIARDSVPKDGDRQAFTVLVRNEGNLTVYTATMTFAGLGWARRFRLRRPKPTASTEERPLSTEAV